MNYASIVPLIGGETIAMQNVFGKKPEYILSYEGFEANDKHLVEYYQGKVPYHLIRDNTLPQVERVDVINTVCPCAGLSSLSPSASSGSAANDWMRTSARHVLGNLRPKVFWGENAPRLASKMGEPVVSDLRKIAEENGYVFSIFKTKSILHGLPQVRDRTFYFFWQGNKVPRFEYIKRQYKSIEDTIRSVPRNSSDPMDTLANANTPSENPFYKYVLEELEGGITHQEFSSKIDKSCNLHDWIEAKTNYKVVSKWMTKHGYQRDADRCLRMHNKLESGFNIMRKGIEVPKDKIGAFVGHLPTSLTHPDEDRFLTIRECMEIMKLPRDFILQGGTKNLNHICQNVPVTTAEDMADHVLKFLDGRLDNQLIETDFVVQDNKSQKLEYKSSSLQLDEFMV